MKPVKLARAHAHDTRKVNFRTHLKFDAKSKDISYCILASHVNVM